MPMARSLYKYLKGHHVSYKNLRCPTNYSAQQLAHAKHISGYDVAKTVVLKTDDGFVVGVTPACYRVDFGKMKKLLGTQELRLATEAEIQKLFPDCELGAMPPFGNIYNVPVYVDQHLKENKAIVFAAGSHTNAIQVKYGDFEKWAKPKLGDFSNPLS
ncbi:MAG: hypothetical protein A3B70_04670 [Deltaproteobacteria bacterium RIFCSPHIGHO2_02_FULL_40_11]|nr:MAG: hypothetical protein A3B70_04670 [Deltaproteobacteria bacterium RIFCSPHIGHO2_02_FULL_40_11]